MIATDRSMVLTDGSMFDALSLQGMEDYVVILIIIGVAILAMAWMPSLTERFRLSYSVIFVAFGCLLYYFLDFLPKPDLKSGNETSLRLTELVVIVSLMGTG